MLGRQGRLVKQLTPSLQLYVRELSGGASAVAIFNRGVTNATHVAVTWVDIGIPAGRKVTAVRALWADKPVPAGGSGVVLDVVDTHDTVVLRVETAAAE